MKKLMCFILALVLILPTLPVFAAEDAGSPIYTTFADYNVYSGTLENDGVIGIPVKINTYVKGTTNSMTQTVIYVINHSMERVGTEDDVSIITDLLNDGYIVVVIDYQNSPLAVSPDLDWSAQGLRTSINGGSYLAGNSYRKDYMYVLPAGCRIMRDVKYFGLLENGAKGTAEATLNTWNTSTEFKNNKGSKIPPCEGNNYKGGWFEATSIDQLVKPDGTPLDFDLRMDFIYPSNPKEAPPFFLWSSSAETRNGVSVSSKRPMQVGFLFRGFATAIYDHEYYPMARNDHYGYFNPYGTASTNGVKTHTAAVRCARYYADKLGFDGSRIGIAGHSKASYSALTAREHPELLNEISDYTQYGYAKGENYGEQPFLTYDDGTPIPSNVQCCYTSMGDGARKYNELLNETTAPSVIACGYYDEFGAWGYWESEQEAYKRWDVVNLAMSMLDLGHAYPYGIDTVYNYDRYAAMMDFFDYQLNGAPPKLVYTNPVDKTEKVSLNEEIKLKFNAPIDEDSFNRGVKVIKTSNNSEVSGTWTKCNGDTEWILNYDELEPEETYNIVVTREVTDKNGVPIDEGTVRRFYTEIGTNIYPTADAYTDSDNATANYGSSPSLTISNNKSIAYLKFEHEYIGKAAKALLNVNVTNNATQKLVFYDVSDFAENEITYENAPVLGTKVGAMHINGAGKYNVDLTDYFKEVQGTAAMAVCAEYPNENSAHIVLDGSQTMVVGREDSNQAYSSKYIVRGGGGFKGFANSSDYDFNNNGSGSYIFKRDASHGRMKFYNSFKDSALTSEDSGKSVKVSFRLYSPGQDVTVSVGTMNATGTYATNFYTSYDTNCTADTWSLVENIFTLDDLSVSDEQIGMITVQATGTHNVYIDDIKFETVGTDVVFDSKEGNFKPKILISESNDILNNASDASYVESGANKNANFSGAAQLYVNGSEPVKPLDGISKSYISFDISSLTDASKAELVLNQVSGSKQKVKVYAIDAGEENVDASSLGGSVHSWNQNSITWQNAVANIRNGNGIDENYAYGKAPVATLATNGAGTYKIDVTSYVNALKTQGAGKVTFVLVPDETIPYVLSYDFENNMNMTAFTGTDTNMYSDTYNFRGGGAIPHPTRTTEQKYSGLYSMKITRTYGYNRLKFYNSIKRSALTENDIGKTYNVSYMMYSNGQDMTINTGLMDASGTYGTSFYKSASKAITANTWTPVTWSFTVDETMVTNQAGMITLQGSGTNTFYIDDFKVMESYAPAAFSSSNSKPVVYSKDMEGTFKAYTATLEDNHPYRSGYDYRIGCWPYSHGLSAEENHTSGGTKSFKFTNREGCTTDRFKLFNCVTTDRDLNESDIGRAFEVSYWIKLTNTGTTNPVSVTVGLMDLNATYSGNSMYKSQVITFNPKSDYTTEWVNFKYNFTIDETIVNNQACMFALKTTGLKSSNNTNLYLDDIVITETSAQSTVGPRIDITKSDSTTESINSSNDAYINSDVQVNYGTDSSLIVGNGYFSQELLSSRKTFMKFEKGDTEEAQTAILKFKTGNGDPQKISIYGIKDPSQYENSITWINAAANDIFSDSVTLSDVYGGAPIVQLDVQPNTKYEVNVFDYVSNTAGSYAAFVITTDSHLPERIIDWDFESGFESFKENADYRKTGAFNGTLALSSEKASSGKKSLKIANINHDYARIKLLNMFKNTVFTSADKNSKYRVSMKIYPTNEGSNGTDIATAKVRIGFYSNYFGTAGTAPVGTYAYNNLDTNTWNDVAFDFTVTDSVINAKVSTLGICQIGSNVYSKNIYIDDLKIEKILSDTAKPIVILNNSESKPTLTIGKPIASEPIAEEFLASINEPVSSGEFKEGDTIVLGANVKTSVNVDVESVEFFNNGEKIDGRVYRDGYDYKIRMYDAATGNYSVNAVVSFSNGEQITTDAKTFTILSGASYTVVNTTLNGSIAAGKSFSVTKTIKNNTSIDANATIIVAVYDGSYNLLTAKVGDSKPLASSASVDLTATIDSVPALASTIMVFIWNNTSDALPLVSAQPIN